MKIKSIRKEKNLTGKIVFLRADFNVPVDKGKIKDDYKIMTALPTIRFLVRHKMKIVIATHLGRPRGKRDKEFSTKIIANRLGALLGKKIKFVDDCVGPKVGREIKKLKEGEIIFLENLRFYKEEKEDNKDFAKKLANFSDIYVNNAFGVSHRADASVSAIKKFLPSFAGLLLENEIVNLSKILKPKKPLVAVVGGEKIETKLPMIKKFKRRAKWILVGGALANNFLLARGFEVGKSLIEKESVSLARKLRSRKIILPLDVVVGKNKYGAGRVEVKDVKKVGKGDIILDIGPETIKLYAKLLKEANTIVWNGPLGKFEAKAFRHGTLAIARVIALRSSGIAFGASGGGETIEALKMTKMIDYMDWVSTGGGAMLCFLGKEKMPGLKGIIK